MSEKNEGLVACGSQVDGDVVPKLVLGTTGKKYKGREVVSCVFPPGLFGTRPNGHVRHAECTLFNGLLNQCAIGKDDEPPTPYWATLDAAISLKKGFTRKDVIELACKTVGLAKIHACQMSWDVLRNHHRHARKREAGMAFMIDVGEDGKLLIRARDEGETLQYFDAQVGRRKEAEATVAATAPAV